MIRATGQTWPTIIRSSLLRPSPSPLSVSQSSLSSVQWTYQNRRLASYQKTLKIRSRQSSKSSRNTPIAQYFHTTSPARARIAPRSHGAGHNIPTFTTPVTSSISTHHDDSIIRQLFDAPPSATASIRNSMWAALGTRGNVGLFKNSYLTSPAGFHQFAQNNMAQANRIVEKVLSTSSVDGYRTIVRDLDRLSDLLCRVLDICNFVRITHPDTQFQNAATRAYFTIFQYMNELNTTTGLNEQLGRALQDPNVTSHWTEEERRVAELLQEDFIKSGIHLSKDQRDRFVSLSQQISEVGVEFVSYSTHEDSVVSLPSVEFHGLDPRIAAAHVNGSYISIPSFGTPAASALSSVHNSNTRKVVYEAFRTSSPATIARLEQMLALRAELAQLAGSQSYSQHSLKSGTMASTPNAVMRFLKSVSDHNRPLVEREVAQLTAYKRKVEGNNAKLEAWDINYYRQKARFAAQIQENHRRGFLSSYFSIGTVIQGLSRLFQRLYGIRFVPRESLPGETWHSDVRRLDVVTDEGEHIAVLYCDLFARDGKSSNPTHFTIRCSREILPQEVEEIDTFLKGVGTGPTFESLEKAANEGMEISTKGGKLLQLPTIALVCGFQHNSRHSKQPALLSLYEVETIFHEMGHAVHSIMARTPFQNVSGTRCATDVAELPSIMMEHFATDPTVLSLFARHWKTDEPLPYKLVAETQKLENLFKGFSVQHETFFAIIDQMYHSEWAAQPQLDSTAFYHQVASEYVVDPRDPRRTSPQGLFSHIHDYGAMYYSYPFDRALARRVWQVVFQDGLQGAAIQRERGERIKENLLKWGGSRDPWRCLADTLQDDRLRAGDERAMELVGSWSTGDASM